MPNSNDLEPSGSMDQSMADVERGAKRQRLDNTTATAPQLHPETVHPQAATSPLSQQMFTMLLDMKQQLTASRQEQQRAITALESRLTAFEQAHAAPNIQHNNNPPATHAESINAGSTVEQSRTDNLPAAIMPVAGIHASSSNVSTVSGTPSLPEPSCSANTLSAAAVHAVHTLNDVSGPTILPAASCSVNQMPVATMSYKTIDLPQFCGSPEQWPIFIAAFRETTQAFKYSPLQNIYRLQKCLSGDARDAVEYLLISPDNVNELIEALEFRFGRPEILVQSQRTKIREFTDISERRTDLLITFSSRVQNLVAFLNNDDSRHILSESSLLAELVDKLPPSKQFDWAHHSMHIKPRPTVIQFSLWLREIADCVCILNAQSAPMRTTQQQPAKATNYGGPSQRSNNRHVLLNAPGTAPRIVCCVCSRTHKVADCNKFHGMNMDDRWATARRLRLCFGCLKRGHQFEMCRDKHACPVGNCTYWHHPMLHSDNTNHDEQRPNEELPTPQAENDEQQRADVNINTNESTSVANANVNAADERRHNNPFDGESTAAVLTCSEPPDELQLLFRVLPVTLYGPTTQIKTYALLDEGSAVTMLDSEVAKTLQLAGPISNLNIQWYDRSQTSFASSQSLRFQISGPSMTRFVLKNVRTVRNLNLPTQSVVISPTDPRHRHLRGLPIAEFTSAVPQMLIGLEHCHLGVSNDTRMNSDGGPIAAHTPLGWIVYGRQGGDSTPAYVLHCTEDDRLDRIVSDYFKTENFGVMAPVRELESDADSRARHIMQTTTVRINQCYQIGLLWRYDEIELPSSYEMAARRMVATERKMGRDAGYKELYHQQIEQFVAKGYARKLSAEEADVQTPRTWYLPHFGVQAAHKPGKLRLVFDAAAEVQGVLLNSVLLTGPDLNTPLGTILFQFRMRPYGVCADIAEMFLQIKIRPEDRCAQRFLWRSSPTDPIEVFEMRSMMFGATCSPTCAQYIKNRNADDHAQEFPAAAEAIRKLHYVDDFVASFATESEAASVTRDVVEIHKRGGFQLRGFVTNSASVLRALGLPERQECVDMQMDAKASEKILGMRWRTHDDAFFFAMRFERVDPDVVAGIRRPSKREVLSAAMSVFDPFGLLADYMLEVKLIVQDLWKACVTWDEPIPTAAYDRWKKWCAVIDQVKELRVPRCYSLALLSSPNVQLHVFADASEQAFAAVAYWRIAVGERYDVSFVCAKTKCAPLKILSIPRLELQAGVLAVRLLNTIRQAHNIPISVVQMWTDSQTVRQWVNSSERRFTPFVAHRVAEILESTDAAQWRWIPTEHNVADDATRRVDVPHFDLHSRFLRGPAFLREDESCWPTAPAVDVDINTIAEEIRPKVVLAVATGKTFFAERLTHFSDADRLICAVALILRFKFNALAKLRKLERRRGPLTVLEMRDGLDSICRVAQREGFAVEYAALEQKQNIDRRSPILMLLPYLDDRGVMRIFGRTDAADPAYLSGEAKRPILLPRHHRLTELVVHRAHREMAHQFEEGTVCRVRRTFWVPFLRQVVRSVKAGCNACKLRAAKPHPPVAGQLPRERLTPNVRAFQFTGLDYFGPVTVRIGRRHEKRWIAVFTCLTTRAIHMEVAQDLSTDACLMCIRNFSNIRGVPQRIRSDCGTNFVGADNEMRRTEDFICSSDVQKALSVKGIEWRFNCPANPEAGGAWERMVQSTKKILAVTLKEAAPPVETLRSLVIEAANLINSCPLTHVPVSANELDPLTPNHFLIGHMNATTAPGEEDAKQLCSRKQWVVQQQMVRQFWRRWVNEFLPELTRRTKFYAERPQLKAGDLVLVFDSNQMRCQWLRGRVVETVVGPDGRVRTATVRTSTGVLRRPVSKLAMLDVDKDEPEGGQLMGPGVSPSAETSVKSS